MGTTFRARVVCLTGVAVALSGALAVAASPARADDGRTDRKSPLPVERCRRTLELAAMAAENDLRRLCLRAVREALGGGPPLAEPSLELDSRQALVVLPRRLESTPRPADFVRPLLQKLHDLWSRRQWPADAVYSTLLEVVLPPSRPAEVFLYPPSVVPLVRWEVEAEKPHSVGWLLVEWARRAGQTEPLRKRLAQRQQHARARLPATVLLAELALAEGDTDRATALLDELRDLLQQGPLQASAESVCELALAALQDRRTAGAALALLESATDVLVQDASRSAARATELFLVAARHRYRRGEAERAEQLLRRYLQVNQPLNVRYTPSHAVFEQRRQLSRVAAEQARAGRVAEALDSLGSFLDVEAEQAGGPDLPSWLVASVLRQLARLPAERRYELLRSWSLPQKGRRSVRLLNALVSLARPPAAFAQLAELPDKPRVGDPETRFGPAPGVASTAYVLVETADELGRLDELADQVHRLTRQRVENAEVLEVLVAVYRGRGADARSVVEQLVAKLSRQLDQPSRPSLTGGLRVRWEPLLTWPRFLVLRAALSDPELSRLVSPLAERTANTRVRDYRLARQLGSDWRVARAVRRCGSWPALQEAARLAWWTAARHPKETSGLWFGHSGFLVPVTGTHNRLYFRYPLTGEFELTCDVYSSASATCRLAYGNVVVEPTGSSWTTVSAASDEKVETVSVLGRFKRFDTYKLRVRPDRVQVFVNGRLVLENKPSSPLDPWLSLEVDQGRSADPSAQAGVFRNVRLAGRPTVPRQVELVRGERLSGWLAPLYDETVRTRPRKAESSASGWAASVPLNVRFSQDPASVASGLPEPADWEAENGEIHGRRLNSSFPTTLIPSHLFYARPLQEGETVEYEFYYQPGAFHVHPTLGRLVFLLRPNGVRLRWLTDAEFEWTALRLDNELDEPDGRRGPSPLPLHAGQWNRVRLTLSHRTVQLSLNDTPVYERPVDPNNSRLFGFYHDKAREAVRVRRVVLRGDWPERLAPEDVAELFAPAEPQRHRSLGPARMDLVGESLAALEAYDVWLQARRLPPEQRYELLFRWVLPGQSHRMVRLYGDFTPTDPPAETTGQAVPLVDASGKKFRAAQADDGKPRRVQTGGQLVAPALELVRTARELNRLDELADAVQQTKAVDPLARRCRLALLALVRMAQGRFDEANKLTRQIYPLLVQVPRWAGTDKRWPEFLLAAEGIRHEATRPLAAVLLDQMTVDQLNKQWPTVDVVWQRHLRRLHSLADRLALSVAERPRSASTTLRNWDVVTHPTAFTRGRGAPPCQWAVWPGQVQHVGGHREDYLYFKVPMRGDYEVRCELQVPGYTATHVVVAGLWLQPEAPWSGVPTRHFTVTRFGEGFKEGLVDPPIPYLGRWYRCRVAVHQGTCTFYVNGRRVFQTRLPKEHDPWVALHASSSAYSGVRNVRISGQPTIPDQLNLSAGPDLGGWLANYYRETTTGPKADWRKEGDEIVGRRKPELAGAFVESLFQYHRPLLEDGWVEYEFYYKPGEQMVHPALDRLVFLLQPDGVRLHWLTDAQYDRSGLAPDNTVDEPQCRRGPARLPLQPDAWNRLRLTVAGDTVRLTLNGQLVYERPIEPTNQRLFGLFHYADQTTARVRHVVYRGQWPRQLPPVEKQELAVDPAEHLQGVPEKAKAELTLDFRKGHPGPKLLKLEGRTDGCRFAADGLHVTVPGTVKKPSSLVAAVPVGLKGDFEMTVTFRRLQAPPGNANRPSGVLLLARIDQQPRLQVTVQRRVNKHGQGVVAAGWGVLRPDGQWRYRGQPIGTSATSGRLRLLRKGNVVYHLFAEGDSDRFRLIRRTVVGPKPVRVGPRVIVQAPPADKPTQVVLTRLTLRAEAIVWPKEPSEKATTPAKQSRPKQ